MPFPDLPQDVFTVPVDRHTASPVSESSLVIPAVAPLSVNLAQLPVRATLVVAIGATVLTEVAYVPINPTEFYCDYSNASLTFHASQAGLTATATYSGIGSVLRAATITELQDAILRTQQVVYDAPAANEALYVKKNAAGSNMRVSVDGTRWEIYDPADGLFHPLILNAGVLGVGEGVP